MSASGRDYRLLTFSQYQRSLHAAAAATTAGGYGGGVSVSGMAAGVKRHYESTAVRCQSDSDVVSEPSLKKRSHPSIASSSVSQ